MLRKMFITHSFLRGARGDLALIVKQPSVTGFDVKLTPMGIAVSLRGYYQLLANSVNICSKALLIAV